MLLYAALFLFCAGLLLIARGVQEIRRETRPGKTASVAARRDAPVPTLPESALDNSANASSGGLVRNSIASYLGNIAGMVTGFFVTPILVRYLGATHFGLWVLLGSLAGYIGLVEAGTSTATAKRVAECRATGDSKRLEEVLGTASALYLGASLIVLVIAVVLVAGLQHLFHFPANELAVARICLLVLGIHQAISFLFLAQTAVLFGAGRIDLMTGFGAAIGIIASIIQAIMAWCGYGIIAMAIILAISTVVRGYVGHKVILKHLPGTRIRAVAATVAMARELLKFGSRNSVVRICGMIAFSADTLVIGLLLPVANVTHYAIASRLVNLITTLATKPVDVMLPAYAHSHTLQDTDRQFRLFSESVSLAMALALPFAIVLCTFGDRLIRAWVGAGHEVSYPIVIILAVALTMQLQGYATITIMTAAERNQVLLKIVMISAPVNLILSVLFTKMLGPIGPALGTLATVTVADAVLLPVVACHDFGFSYRAYLSHSILPFVIPTCAATVLAGVLKTQWNQDGLPWLFAAVASTMGLFWLLWLMLGLQPQRRAKYLHAMRAAFGLRPTAVG
ncbi:MAG TPA: oligosaccharide flippase family protein [Abditibacteriaceae bacterium]|nr:oligosaccharide flippase family protein [Abditibacteriaceae bacterium]